MPVISGLSKSIIGHPYDELPHADVKGFLSYLIKDKLRRMHLKIMFKDEKVYIKMLV